MRKPGLLGACWPTPLQEEILRAAVEPPADAAAAWQRVRGQIDLDDLWDAEVHRLLPLVHGNLRAAGVDDPDLPRLKGLHRRTWYENQVALHRVRPAIELLQGAGIRVLFLKGAPLALLHYGDLGLRPMADVDVLVPWDDAHRALDLLEAAGWADVGGHDRATLFRRYHGSGLVHPDGGQLDLHWHLGTPLLLPDDERASSDDFWAHAVPFAAATQGIDALTLAPTDMLLHVIAHGLWAGSASTVRWVADARVVIADGEAIDWDRLVDQATRRRMAPLVADALRYLVTEVGAPVPPGAVAALQRVGTSRRERRLLRALAGPTEAGAVVGGLPHLRSYWAYTRLKWPAGRAARELPGFIADLWSLDRRRQVPVAAAQRVLRRLRGAPEGVAGVPSTARVPAPTVGVVVPTHHRPEHLARCLEALAAQTTPPAQVVVVRGADDLAAAEVVAAHGEALQELVADGATAVERLHAGAAAVRAPVVAFTDDDAAPHPDWVERLAAHLTDPSVGAVGGRDRHATADGEGTVDVVGRIGAGGRVVGGHSCGHGPARDVEHLRGVNMAVRRHLLRLPDGLRGPGAQGYHELATSLAVLAEGRRVVYDPAVLVDHHLAPRFEHGDGDRHHAATAKRADDAFNQTYVLLSLRPRGRFLRMAYVLLVGDRSTGGLLRCAWALVRGDRRLAREVGALARAHLDAWREHRRRPLRLVRPDEPLSPSA